jgi:hypothetical protein
MKAVKIIEKSNMDLINQQQAKREVDRVQANRDELVERISQTIRADATIKPLKGLHLHRFSSPMKACHAVSIPAFCVIA